MKVDVTTVGEGSFEEVLEGAESELCEIGRALRSMIASVMPGVTEVAWVRQRTIGYGVGPKKNSEHFCYIGVQARHINLGFFYGADLEDADGLLEGTGKLLRHVKIRSVEEANQPSLRELVTRASRHLPKLNQ